MRYYLFFILLLAGNAVKALPAEDSVLLQKGIVLFGKGDYEQSVSTLNRALEISIREDHKLNQVVIYNNLGNNYATLGKTVDAIGYYQRSIKLAEQLGDKKKMAATIKNVGTLYSESNDFGKALEKFSEAEAIALQLKDTFNIADCANNKGVIYEQQKKYPEALAEYKKALELYTQLKNEERLAITYNNLGIVYKYLKDYANAVKYYELSMTIGEKQGDKFLVAANLNNMGNVYLLMKDYKKAADLNKRSLEIAREINSWDIITEAAAGLADDYAAMGDHKAAYDLYKQYAIVKDSVLNVERSKQVAELHAKYDTEKKDNKIKQQSLLIQKRNYQAIAVTGISVLLIVIGLLLYNRQRLKQRQLREKAILNAEYNERIRIARDVHDDLGSGLSKISLMAELAVKETNGNTPAAIRNISHISKDLVSNMRDLVWVLNPENTTLDNLVARLREYYSDYLDGMNLHAELNFADNIPATKISREAQRNIFLTVKEALNNSVKHAGASKIAMHLSLNGDELNIMITDNGKGFEEARIRSGGNGLRNMKQRIEAINGRFAINSRPDEGTELSITVQIEDISVGNTTIM